MNILVTICARGGSKGVRNKNVRPLMGKPLIGYTIEQAISWGRATDVVVSTDSEEIIQVSKDFGAMVPFVRPEELARDDSPKIPVIRHALKECESVFDKEYSIVVDLDPTSLLRKPDDIEMCYQKFLKEKPLTLFSVVRAGDNPYFNMVEVDDNGFASLSKKTSSTIPRRQDAPSVYSMNASIYVYDRNFMLNEVNVSPFSERSLVYVMDDMSGCDIDREVDFKFVEFAIKEGLFQL